MVAAGGSVARAVAIHDSTRFKGDIDLFLYATEPAAAEAIVDAMAAELAPTHLRYDTVRATSFIPETETERVERFKASGWGSKWRPMPPKPATQAYGVPVEGTDDRVIQIVRMLHASRSHVIESFDLAPCRVLARWAAEGEGEGEGAGAGTGAGVPAGTAADSRVIAGETTATGSGAATGDATPAKDGGSGSGAPTKSGSGALAAGSSTRASAGGLVVEGSASWLACVRHMAFPVDTRCWGRATTARVLKYMSRGYEAFLPGIERGAMKPRAATRMAHGDTSLGGLLDAEAAILAARASKPAYPFGTPSYLLWRAPKEQTIEPNQRVMPIEALRFARIVGHASGCECSRGGRQSLGASTIASLA